MATHTSVLAWRIPGMEEPGGLPSMGSHRVGHDRSDLAVAARSVGKESACNAGDPGSIPGSGRCPGEGNGYPLQYFGLENSMDCIVRGILQARILEWVAFPLSSKSSQPRNRTRVSCIAGGFFAN